MCCFSSLNWILLTTERKVFFQDFIQMISYCAVYLRYRKKFKLTRSQTWTQFSALQTLRSWFLSNRPLKTLKHRSRRSSLLGDSSHSQRSLSVHITAHNLSRTMDTDGGKLAEDQRAQTFSNMPVSAAVTSRETWAAFSSAKSRSWKTGVRRTLSTNRSQTRACDGAKSSGATAFSMTELGNFAKGAARAWQIYLISGFSSSSDPSSVRTKERSRSFTTW